MSQEDNSNLSLNINDLFWTIQGEGKNSGRRALFVRMPFCNLACSWCDTTFDTFKRWSVADFVAFASKEKARFAVITGGEPTMNKHTPLVIKALTELGFQIAVESNGTFPIPNGIDFVTISPKRDAKYEINPDAFTKASEFKYVVDEGFDFGLLDRHDVTDGRRYSLSPEFGNMEKSLERMIDYIKEHPVWRISLQTHKWMKVP
jgi:7-carboxy-7-deazaguanine synthase